jgi:radial spoke head protein 1
MKLVGEWKENTILDGKWIFPNGTYYEGKFTNNKPNGEGVWHYPNHNSLKGFYKQTIIPNED